jgi:hypothetical protein
MREQNDSFFCDIMRKLRQKNNYKVVINAHVMTVREAILHGAH